MSGTKIEGTDGKSMRVVSAQVRPENKKMHDLERFKQMIPDLGDQELHKGSCGRVGIIGGSAQYTGAPYYAGISSLKFGSDLVYVFSAKEAALAIKGYSPELMVTPVYSSEDFESRTNNSNFEEADSHSSNRVKEQHIEAMVARISSKLGRLHGLLVGPGLGRDPCVLSAVAKILSFAREQRSDLPLILDADALWLIANRPQLVSGNAFAVLTPNIREYEALWRSIFSPAEGSHAHPQERESSQPDTSPGGVATLATRLGVTIIFKSKYDIISNGKKTLVCSTQGGLRRSGGLGDILAGCIATAVVWAVRAGGNSDDICEAAYAACHVAKVAARTAYNEKRRSMTAPDVISVIGLAFQQEFPSKAV